MSNLVRRHRLLEQRLCIVRWFNRGAESQEEDSIVDQMEALWWQMSSDERDEVDRDPAPHSLIRPSGVQNPPHRAIRDARPSLRGSHRILREVG